jgi:hypothetical protein
MTQLVGLEVVDIPSKEGTKAILSCFSRMVVRSVKLGEEEAPSNSIFRMVTSPNFLLSYTQIGLYLVPYTSQEHEMLLKVL